MILKGIAAADRIDYALVAAQEARRVIDRLVGYTVSPALSQSLSMRGLSAGRVQSVVLKLLVNRDKHINGFEPVEHYGVQVTLAADEGNFVAYWDFTGAVADVTALSGSDENSEPSQNRTKLLTDRELATALMNRVRNDRLRVVTIDESPKRVSPPKPLITSSFQDLALLNTFVSKAGDSMQGALTFDANIGNAIDLNDNDIIDVDRLEADSLDVTDGGAGTILTDAINTQTITTNQIFFTN